MLHLQEFALSADYIVLSVVPMGFAHLVRADMSF